MIGIIDYGVGNLASVLHAFDRIEQEVVVFDDPEKTQSFDRLVLPGVGSFRSGMDALTASGWAQALKTFVDSGKPLLGICLGMQLFFDRSEEHGLTQGLGFIPGEVLHLEQNDVCWVPHVGWNNLNHMKVHPLLKGIKPKVDFYFVHSYHCVPQNLKCVLATCDYGSNFVAGVVHNNVVGFQFHPEKSQPSGVKLLKNFAEWDGGC